MLAIISVCNDKYIFIFRWKFSFRENIYPTVFRKYGATKCIPYTVNNTGNITRPYSQTINTKERKHDRTATCVTCVSLQRVKGRPPNVSKPARLRATLAYQDAAFYLTTEFVIDFVSAPTTFREHLRNGDYASPVHDQLRFGLTVQFFPIRISKECNSNSIRIFDCSSIRVFKYSSIGVLEY